MMLKNTSELSMVKDEQDVGFRVVDVNEITFDHNFIPLDNNLYCKDCKTLKKDIPDKKEQIIRKIAVSIYYILITRTKTNLNLSFHALT